MTYRDLICIQICFKIFVINYNTLLLQPAFYQVLSGVHLVLYTFVLRKLQKTQFRLINNNTLADDYGRPVGKKSIPRSKV